MSGRSNLSLMDIVMGAKPQAPQKRRRHVAKPSERAAQTVPAVFAVAAASPDVTGLFAGLAGLEQAAASLRAGIVALGQVQAAPVAASPQASPAIGAGDERISYRLSEAAKALGVSAKVLRREIAAGKIPHRICGRITIISKAALDAYARGEAVKD